MSRNIDLAERRSRLSPEKQRLLEKRLQKSLEVTPQTATISRRPLEEVAPLSFAQERLWFLDQLEPGNPAYNRPFALRLSGLLDQAVLAQSLSEILRRHEVLRATFSNVEGQPVQVIKPAQPITLPLLDLTAFPPPEQEAQALRLLVEESQRPFDLAHPPLLRVHLVRLEEESHLLLVVAHHITFDGWSAHIFIKELAVLYEAFISDKASPLAELPIQYADFAYWQRERLQGERQATQLAYWQENLAGLPPTLDLPSDRPRPPMPAYRGGHLSLLLPPDLVQALTHLSQREGVTLFMTLLAAFQTLLYRYTGQEDIAVGSPVAGRTYVETETLIGFCINTLVLRTHLSGQLTFRELLGRVRETALGAYAHQDLPFEKLLESLKWERDPSRTPLFQVMFNLENVPQHRAEIQGLQIEEFDFDSQVAVFDLELEILKQQESLCCLFKYNSDLFDAETVTRWAGHFRILLESILANSEAQIGQLSILSQAEQQQLLVEWNRTQVDDANEACIHHLFEAQVEQTPETPALFFPFGPTLEASSQLSYWELNRRANQLAHHLQAKGVGPESRVGLCLERSPEMIVGLLAVLKAGGAYVPFDPIYPEERLAFMAQDAQISLVLTQEELSPRFLKLGLEPICLDTGWEIIARQCDRNPGSEVRADNLAYIIYTSGSTGKPKGVMIPHRALVNFTRAATLEYELGPADRVLQFASISFDASAEEIYPCLTRGATLVLRPNTMLDSLAGFLERCRDWQLTVVDLPTAFWHELTLALAAERLAWPERLRLVIIGGERALPERLRLWHQCIDGEQVRLVNTYGPTETTVVATLGDVSKPDCLNTGAAEIPIGRPLRHVQVYVLDQNLQPVPIGVPGELHIGGAGLARGYINQPELTTQKFITNPVKTNDEFRTMNDELASSFIIHHSSFLYKSGDLVRYRPDGQLEFLGRIDHQVKIRGFRIELGEIEAVLSQHPAIREVAVLAREDIPGERRLVAYVTVAQSPAPIAGELRHYLKGKLPDYMCPSAFVFLGSLPLTSGGKLDRRALPLPQQIAVESLAAPRTETEQRVAKIWSEVLGLEQIGIHDNFFELGGHSLATIQVVSRLNNSFQLELPLRRLFDLPTIAELASALEEIKAAATYPQAPALAGARTTTTDRSPLEPAEDSYVLPASFSQQRLWFLDQLDPGQSTYNMPAVLRLYGQLDEATLEQSFNEIIQRHETLRTTFAYIDDQPVQVISPTLTLKMSIIDLSHLSEVEREAEAWRLAAEEGQQPFDLGRGPLLRVKLLRLEQEEHLLLFTVHHIVSDGWSQGVLKRELVSLYEAFSAGQPSPLPPLALQYADFAVWQREWLQGPVLEEQLAYWVRQLEGYPPLSTLPTDQPRPPVKSYRGWRESFIIPETLSQACEALSRQEGKTLFMFLLAAFKTLLYRYTDQADILVGSPIASRNREEIEPLIGFFANTLALRTNLAGEPTFRELLDRVREVTLEAYSHQDLPFEKLVEALRPARDPSHTPMFQVMFALQNTPRSVIELPGLTMTPVSIERDTAKFDLSLTLTQETEGIKGVFIYNTDLFEAATIRRLSEHFQMLLAAITANPDIPISTLPLFSPVEQQQLLEKWNKTRLKVRGYPIDPDQIKSVLSQHPAVRQIHILVHEDGPEDQRFVAYVVPRQGQAPAAAELRRFLREKLPAYMTPSVFISLAALPLTAAGEIDCQALPRSNQIRDNLEESFAPPRNELERQLVQAWEEVLATRPIGIRDSFFELGGHSLLAVRLLAQIEKIAGRKLHLATLFQAPTIEQQAKILQEGSTSLLLPIQPDGSRRPFFCVPGGGDNAFIFTELVRHLGPEQPFYSFRFPRQYNKQTAAARVEEMATQYIQQIKQLQPEGPYLLGGYCFGGKVAFEMAQQLQAQGEQVSLVALFECYLPGAAHLANFGQRVRHHLNNFLQLPLQEKLAFVLEMGKRRFLKISRKLSPDLGRPVHEAMGETKYVPQRYPGRLTLFHAVERNPALYYEPEMGWGGLAAEGIEVYAIPGTHIDAYKDPNVQAWAELMRSCLDRAQA